MSVDSSFKAQMWYAPFFKHYEIAITLQHKYFRKKNLESYERFHGTLMALTISFVWKMLYFKGRF